VAIFAAAPHRKPVLSLADLDLAAGSVGEVRAVCPLCAGERRKANRRDLSVNLSTGLWHCWHCDEAGMLRDFWDERSGLTRKQLARERLRRSFSLTPRQEPDPDPADAPWRTWLTDARDLAGTPGEAYLAGRGIPRDLAHLCGVQYIADWYGRPGVLFPLRDETGEIQAAGVRYIDGRTDPKTRTAGKLSLGVFATPSALSADPVIVTEGPADALSIASTGRSAIALHRTSAPAWLAKKLAFRCVLVAMDADTTGDADSEKLIAELRSYGATAVRLRPPAGKDWNDTLLAWGIGRFTRWIETACYRYEPCADAVANARCRLCREPSHTGDCVGSLPRPGPYGCPDLAYGRGCRPCEARITRGPQYQPIIVPPRIEDVEQSELDV
jgi:hypothetical protein